MKITLKDKLIIAHFFLKSTLFKINNTHFHGPSIDVFIICLKNRDREKSPLLLLTKLQIYVPVCEAYPELKPRDLNSAQASDMCVRDPSTGAIHHPLPTKVCINRKLKWKWRWTLNPGTMIRAMYITNSGFHAQPILYLPPVMNFLKCPGFMF